MMFPEILESLDFQLHPSSSYFSHKFSPLHCAIFLQISLFLRMPIIDLVSILAQYDLISFDANSKHLTSK